MASQMGLKSWASSTMIVSKASEISEKCSTAWFSTRFH